MQANRRRSSSISMQGFVGRHRCVISVMTRLERAEPCRGRLCSPLVSSERPGQQMCFLKECLRLVGCCRKTEVHLLPSGRVVDCLLCSFSISLLLLYNQHNCTFAFLLALCASLKSFPTKFIFSTKHPFHSLSQTITSSPPSGCLSSSSPAHQPSHRPSEGRPGPPGAAVLGARQRRPVACALLHGAAPGASGQQLDGPLRLRQPRGHQLRCFWVKHSLLFSHFLVFSVDCGFYKMKQHGLF